ncbi:MAG: hypothetical protein IJK42_12890 [Prevotella sp.]|nr:hypothetical protein [Prevotella sp.]
MKIYNYTKFFLSMLACVLALQAHATDWTGSAPTAGEKYYLYNVGQQKFIAHGANWGTRAISDEAGIQFTLEENNGKYRLNSGIGNTPYLGVDQYVDQAALDYTLVEVSGKTNVYYFTFVPNDNTMRYLLMTNSGGVDKAKETSGGTWTDEGCQWMLITKAERNQMLANGVGSDTDPLDITYKYLENNRTTWYTEPYDDATSMWSGWTLNGSGGYKGIRDRNGEVYNKDFDNAINLTGLPSGKYRYYVTGYYRDGSNDASIQNYFNGTPVQNALIYATGSVSTNETAMQTMGAGASTTQLGDEETSTANGTEYYRPNTQTEAILFFYNNKFAEQYVDAVVGDDGVLTIGVKKETTIGGDWTLVDKMRLEYRGEYHGPADGGKYYLYNVGAKMFIGHGDQWGYHALQDEAGLEMTLEETDGKYRIATGLGYLGSDGYCDKGADQALAVYYEFVPVEGVDNAYYLKFTDSGDGNEKYLLFTNNGKYANKATTATGGTWPEGYSQWKLYTKAERDAMLTNMVGINGEAVTEDNPLDISYKIPNNHTAYYTRCYTTDDPFGFKSLDNGALEGANDGGTLIDRNAQGWTNTADRKWDANMTFSGLPEGKYRFYVTGFYRDGNGNEAYTRYTGGTFDPRAKIYMTTTETTTTDLQSIAVGASTTSLGGNESVDGEYRMPNTQATAAYYFFNSKYPEQYVEGTVGMNGQLTIGIKVDKTIANNWLVVDKVRLEYLGPDIPTTNVTNMLVNPTFDGTDGWTTAEGNNFAANTETVAENFATTFDMYQDVSGLEPGVYKISVQGFYRNSRSSANGGNYSAADVARNVRTIGQESLNSYLYARVGDQADIEAGTTEGKNSLLSIFDATYGTTGSNNVHSSILPNVPGGMNVAHEAFETGLYTDNSMIVEVTNSGLLRLGIKKETTTDRDWTCFDNMKLYKLDCTLVEALAHEFESRRAEAEAIMNSADYANVPDFSTEYQNLDAAISVDVSGFTTPYQYYAVLDAMRPALNAFKASKYWYDRFKGVYDAAIAVGVDVTGYSTISMGQAPDAIKALVVATENAVNTAQDGDDDKYGNCTEVYMKGWTIQQFNTASGQHWDGTTGEGATEYYDKNGDGTLWYMSQSVTLPKGEYVLKVAGRSNLLDNIQEYTITFGNKTVHLPTLGGGTPGIATNGTANYSAGEHGWEWRYVPLKITEAGNYEIRIAMEKDNVWSWASAADVQLLGSKEALAEGLLLLADKLREKIEEIDKAYYGSPISELPSYSIFTDLDYNGHTYWEKNVAEMFQTKNTENTYDQRQSYVYDYDKDGTAESVTASSASTAIGLVNYYNLMHGAVLSTADYRKAMLVMQTKIDMAASNAASYVYTRRAMLRAETFADLEGDIYENNAAAVANLQTRLAQCDATLKHAIALASGTDGTLDTKEEIVNSWDDTTHWIADNIKTSGLYKQALDEIKAATREFIDAITVKDGEALNITDVFLYNPSFDYNNPDGWTANGSTRPHNCNTNTFAAYVNSGYADVTTTYVNHYVEFYELHGNPGGITGNYNSFQTVTGLPAGVYKFTATGSYRQERILNSAPQRALGNEDITAELYASGSHMAEVPVEYTVVEETGEVDDEGNPITQEVTYTRMEQQVIIDTDRSMPLFSLYKDADQTGLTEGLFNDDRNTNTVYGAVPVDFVNYMPVVNHYDGNTVMFGVTATDGTEDVTVGVRDNYADLREHSWAVLDNFELYYISPNIVGELSNEWEKRVELAQTDYDTYTSPQASKYGVALANYFNNYDPTTAIADSELGVESSVLNGLTTAEKNELKYNKALRDLHVAQNDYEAAIYWFDQLAAANAVANSFPYVSGTTIASDNYAGSTENISYDEYNVMLESAVDANTTMENARDKTRAVRTLADGLFGTGATNYYDVDLTSNLGTLDEWTVGANSSASATLSGQHFNGSDSYIEPSGCFANPGWTFNISKTVTLEKGLYMFKIAARRAGGVTKCDIKVTGANVGTLTPVADATSAYNNYRFITDGTSFTKGDVTIAVPRSWNDASIYSGDSGYGIAADGTTDYTAGNNYGWQWEYIPFVVAKGSDVTFTIDAESKSYYTWASFAEAQLWQGPIPTSVNENQDWDLEKCYANAHVTRSIPNTTTAKTWGTIVLPYNKPLPDGWDIRQQVSKNESQDKENNNIIDFQRPKYTEGVTGEDDPSDLSSLDDETIVINRPYVIQVANAVANPWSDNRVQINPAEKPYTENTYVEMIGMYNPGEIAIGDFYIAQNKFWRVTVKPQATKGLRVYFHVKESDPDANGPDNPTYTTEQVKRMLIGYGVKVYGDDEQIVSEDGGFVDGIDNVNVDETQGEYYDLQGRRVSTPRHGVYIQNGKKHVVK